MTDDRLKEIFELQNQLNLRIGVDASVIKEDPEQMRQWILNYSRAMSQELAELIDSVPWKWWAKYQELDLQNARVEVVDMLHFLVSLCQVMGMSEQDLYDMYVKKHQVNHQRQDSGYAQKNHEDSKHL